MMHFAISQRCVFFKKRAVCVASHVYVTLWSRDSAL